MNNRFILLLIVVGLCISCGNRNFIPEPEEVISKIPIKPKQDTVKQIKKAPILPIQKKYAKSLGVEPNRVKPVALYNFIDRWIDAPYRLGGEDKRGIDCSYFTLYLYHDVFNKLIERTASKQYHAPDTDLFIGQEHIRMGDLLFFNIEGSEFEPITHVGIYLSNDRFVHSTAKRGSDGKNGVQISNFKSKHWQKLFVAAGRKPGIAKAIQSLK
ncbi:C40 family peptidase [Spongiivirga sp. MCCC 1A20706]|uniref:C40 family peptidase n=1 Tax=Spongiivirga sp. MCCC 1A20706 TaxID=3160963 RepID=UPI003977B340